MIYQNETIEWSRVWREDADTDKARVLLIGDSIIDNCKHNIYERLKEVGLTSSAYITSKGINNSFYLKEVDLVCAQENYDYAAVFIQYGGHSGLQKRAECRENYIKLLHCLVKMLPDTPFILAPFTPWTKGNGTAGDFDTPVTERVSFAENNKFVTELREDIIEIIKQNELGIDLYFFDSYSLMLENNDEKLPDGVHFTAEGSRILGTAIAEKILEVINKKEK